VVFDEKEEPIRANFPREVEWHKRDALPNVQDKYRKIKGVSAILFIQTCAAEKRRRRKRGTFDDPDKRVFINTDICEGCGDCGMQSNCVSIVPVETELGRKRAIDQSSCNKDFSCLNGFCPSFVTVEGAQPRKEATAEIETGDLAQPNLPEIDRTHNIVITGVGGTGVVTIGAILAMAARLDGKGAGMMEMAGLAQKGGAVHIHCRIADAPEDISAIRVATGEADTLIGGDLVVSAGAKTLGLMAHGRARAVVNSHEIMTGDFTRDTDFRIPSDQLALSLEARLKNELTMLDATTLAARIIGDAIYSNMLLLGASWQLGQLPLTHEALAEAIRLNGTNVDENLRAFEIGRWAAQNPEAAAKVTSSGVISKPASLEEIIAFREGHLTAYQSVRLARRYRKMVDRFESAEIKDAVARGYHKLLAYKDEYEVARLLTSSRQQAEATFSGDLKLTYHLAPPILSRVGSDGRPKKRRFGAWAERMWPYLARLKWLRGTPFDPFGYTADRRLERRLIRQYERDMKRILKEPTRNTEAAIEVAGLPLQIRGFGPVKADNATAAAMRRDELLAAIETGQDPSAVAAE
ncbi:MAG: DUF6537 domain-containing protein, partial [Boseongicola sp.]